jgi:hypothetical protein
MASSFIIGKQEPLTTIKLIDGKEAATELRKVDDFVLNLGSFDLEARLNTKEGATIEKYFDFITKQIIPWDAQCISMISEIIESLSKNCTDTLKLCNLPKEILVILTNGKDEAGAAYCRNLNAIILPITKKYSWHTTFPHEMFHIISRNNLELQGKLYGCIGYQPMPDGKIARLPGNISNLKMTNPDAPVTKHYIRLQIRGSPDGEPSCLAPVLVASGEFEPNSDRNFFGYLLTRFAVLDEETWEVKRLIPYDDAVGFYDKVGRNTKYIIHPEETIADNFVHLINGETNVPSPWVLEKMRRALASNCKL